MMFTFVNYTIITCYIACVRYQETKKGSSERSFCRQLQHAVWRRQNQQSLEDIPLPLWRLPKIVGNAHARGFWCFQEAEKGDDCPGCRDPGRAKVWVWQACSALSTSSQGALVLRGKAGRPIGSVPRLLSRLQWEGVWVSPCVFLFPVVNTFLWVKHLLPLYTFGIVGIIRHVLFHCFFLSLKYYLNS